MFYHDHCNVDMCRGFYQDNCNGDLSGLGNIIVQNATYIYHSKSHKETYSVQSATFKTTSYTIKYIMLEYSLPLIFLTIN